SERASISGMMTAAATTGPARQPLPTSSVPTSVTPVVSPIAAALRLGLNSLNNFRSKLNSRSSVSILTSFFIIHALSPDPLLPRTGDQKVFPSPFTNLKLDALNWNELPEAPSPYEPKRRIRTPRADCDANRQVSCIRYGSSESRYAQRPLQRESK